MEITFDPAKRDATLQARGLDFTDAGKVFQGLTATRQDTRFDYPEPRFVTAGELNGRLVVIVLDAHRRGPPDHFDEVRACPRRTPLAGADGLIPTTRRN